MVPIVKAIPSIASKFQIDMVTNAHDYVGLSLGVGKELKES